MVAEIGLTVVLSHLEWSFWVKLIFSMIFIMWSIANMWCCSMAYLRLISTFLHLSRPACSAGLSRPSMRLGLDFDRSGDSAPIIQF